jgi:hypothetical protein
MADQQQQQPMSERRRSSMALQALDDAAEGLRHQVSCHTRVQSSSALQLRNEFTRFGKAQYRIHD